MQCFRVAGLNIMKFSCKLEVSSHCSSSIWATALIHLTSFFKVSDSSSALHQKMVWLTVLDQTGQQQTESTQSGGMHIREQP